MEPDFRASRQRAPWPTSGIEVVVLEARERIGGRVWTEDGIDLGAHWIHGTEGNPITNLARELGVPTLFVGGDSSYTGGWEQLQLRSGGQPLSQELKERSITLIDEIRDAIETLRRKLELERRAGHFPGERN